MKVRQHINRWIRFEQGYLDAKNGVTQRRKQDDVAIASGDLLNSNYWTDIQMYVSRAQALGIDSQLGRQALAKGLMVYRAMVEASVEIWGALPPAGLPSGETCQPTPTDAQNVSETTTSS
jgi:hypothetical protein